MPVVAYLIIIIISTQKKLNDSEIRSKKSTMKYYNQDKWMCSLVYIWNVSNVKLSVKNFLVRNKIKTKENISVNLDIFSGLKNMRELIFCYHILKAKKFFALEED